MHFYVRALGAELVMLLRHRDGPGPGPVAPGTGHRVNHAVLRLGDSVLMAADDDDATPMPFRGFALSIRARDETEARRVFAALADGGVVTLALAATAWSPLYGMVTDRFGIAWMVSVTEPGGD